MDVDDGKWKEAKNFEADFRIISSSDLVKAVKDEQMERYAKYY